MTEKDVLFVEDVARIFQIAPGTIRRRKWREKNGIPLRRIGKRLCSTRGEIEHWYKGMQWLGTKVQA